MRFARQDSPPPAGPEIFIRRLKASQPYSCVILSEAVQGFWTHWKDKSTIPCITPTDACPSCRMHLPRRWKGYLHVYYIPGRCQEFLEITPIAAECLIREFPAGVSLRGHKINVTRGNGQKARLSVSVFPADMTVSENSWPKAKDVTPALAKIWHVDLNSVH